MKTLFKAFVAFLFLTFPFLAQSTTFLVVRLDDPAPRAPLPSCQTLADQCSLRETVLAANVDRTATLQQPHQIILQSGQTYLLQIRDNFKPLDPQHTEPEDQGLAGDLDLDNFISIHPDGNGKATIQGDQSNVARFYNSRLVHVLSSGTVFLKNLILRQGLDLEDFGGGGAILNEGELNIQNLELVENNTLFHGGGIRNGTLAHPNAILTMTDIQIERNRVNGFGGGIQSAGDIDAQRVEIRENDSIEEGGGINNEGFALFRDSTIARNRSVRKGGGVTNFFAISFRKSRIQDNQQILGINDFRLSNIHNLRGFVSLNSSTLKTDALNTQGCINITNFGGLNIFESLLQAGQSCLDGGRTATGLETTAGTLFMENSTVHGFSRGLLIHVAPNQNYALQFSTFAENEIGIEIDGSANNILQVGASLFSSSQQNCLRPNDGSTPIASIGANLETANSCGFNQNGDLVNVQDLKLGPLGSHGGPTQVHPLLAGSPAIDHADFSSTWGTDQREFERPQGRNNDSGAYEYTSGSDAIRMNLRSPIIFPDTPIRQASRLDLSLTNQLLAGLQILNVQPDPLSAPFEVDFSDCKNRILAQLERCAVKLVFRPLEIGDFESSKIQVQVANLDTPLEFILKGRGIAPSSTPLPSPSPTPQGDFDADVPPGGGCGCWLNSHSFEPREILQQNLLPFLLLSGSLTFLFCLRKRLKRSSSI